ncbi:Torsin-1B [Chamberlinius hualienensis]
MESDNVVVFRKLSTAASKQRLRTIISNRRTIQTLHENSEISLSCLTADDIERNILDNVTSTRKLNSFRRSTSVPIIKSGQMDGRFKMERRSLSFSTTRQESNADDADELFDLQQLKERKNSLIGLYIYLSVILIFIFMAYSYLILSDENRPDSLSNYEVDKLIRVLSDRVYGQELAIRTIVDELNKVESTREPYILALDFIGSTGTGKTYVSQIISHHLTKLGGNVYWHTAPHLSASWLASRVVLQEINVFIIDDYSQNLESFVQCIKQFKMLLKSSLPDILKLTKCLFVISSNRNAEDVVAVTVKANSQSILREKLTLKDFSFLLSVDGVPTALEDEVKHVFVPFLPLTRDHVAKCVKRIVGSFDMQPIHYDEYVSIVLNSLKYFPVENPIFSQLGCKKLPFI